MKAFHDEWLTEATALVISIMTDNGNVALETSNCWGDGHSYKDTLETRKMIRTRIAKKMVNASTVAGMGVLLILSYVSLIFFVNRKTSHCNRCRWCW